jgi:hypothetical protein
MSIQIDHFIRTRRKTIALIIQRDGSLMVRAPLRMPEARIMEFIESHAGWIRKKQVVAKASPPPAIKGFVEGEFFLYLGKEHPLNIVPHQRPQLIFEQEVFSLAHAALPNADQVFIRWYKSQALSVITDLVDRCARENGFSYKRIRISSARTRWGSCSSTGTLSFSWRLILASPEVVEYVVVHELVHTKIKNHSSRFWRGVEEIMPNYEEYVLWLKKNGTLLTLD